MEITIIYMYTLAGYGAMVVLPRNWCYVDDGNAPGTYTCVCVCLYVCVTLMRGNAPGTYTCVCVCVGMCVYVCVTWMMGNASGTYTCVYVCVSVFVCVFVFVALIEWLRASHHSESSLL